MVITGVDARTSSTGASYARPPWGYARFGPATMPGKGGGGSVVMERNAPIAAGPAGTGVMSSAYARLTLSRTRLVFVASAVVAVVLIMTLTSGLWFHGDEWAYIVDRRLTLESMLQPHNEHLVFLHVLVYRGLVAFVGTGSYLPYLAVLMAVHVAAAAGVLALLTRYVPLAAALAGAILLLFLGTGYDNLVWAFQIGFAGAIALGIWAMATTDRPWLSAILLTAALWTAGSGLFFVAPVALLIKDRRWLLVPLVTYGLWLAFVGREYIPFPGAGPYLAFAATGIGSAFGGAAGLGVVSGWIIVALVGVLLARSGRPSRAVVAGLVGLLCAFAVLALGRAHLGPHQAETSRYVYAALPFVLMTLTGVRVRRTIWTGVFIVAVTLNIAALARGVAVFEGVRDFDRTLTMEQRLAPFR